VTRLGFSRAAFAAAFAALAAVAHADQTELCYDAERPFDSAPPDNSRVFQCPTAGSATVPQLAAAGWRIVKLTPVSVDSNVRNQLLIRQTTRIFRNGFE
jgi:hypothetical protein